MTSQEINEAVARKLGWHWNDDKVSGGHWHYDGGCYDNLPGYCHSIEAAWEIVEHLAKNNLLVEIKQHGLGKPSYAVYISNSIELLCGVAYESAPLAICLAFLKLP